MACNACVLCDYIIKLCIRHLNISPYFCISYFSTSLITQLCIVCFCCQLLMLLLLVVLLTYNSEGTITKNVFGFQDLLIIVKSLSGLKLTLRDQMFNLKGYWMEEQHPNPLFRRCGFTSVRAWVFHKIKNITLLPKTDAMKNWNCSSFGSHFPHSAMKLSTLNLKTPLQTSISDSITEKLSWFENFHELISLYNCKQIFFIQQTFSTLLSFSILYFDIFFKASLILICSKPLVF